MKEEEEEEEAGSAAAAEDEEDDAGAHSGQAEPTELQWRSGSPTFLWNTVFTLRDEEEGRGAGPGGRGGLGGASGTAHRVRNNFRTHTFRKSVCE